MSRMFSARYDSRCRSCGDEIWVGDDAGYIDGEDGVHCAGCVDAADDEDN